MASRAEEHWICFLLRSDGTKREQHVGRQEGANRRRRLNPNPREDVGLPCEESCQRTCCWQSVHRAKGGIKNNNINASLTHACPARFLSPLPSLSQKLDFFLFPSSLHYLIRSRRARGLSLFYIYRNYLIRFIPRAASSSSSNLSSTPPTRYNTLSAKIFLWSV